MWFRARIVALPGRVYRRLVGDIEEAGPATDAVSLPAAETAGLSALPVTEPGWTGWLLLRLSAALTPSPEMPLPALPTEEVRAKAGRADVSRDERAHAGTVRLRGERSRDNLIPLFPPIGEPDLAGHPPPSRPPLAARTPRAAIEARWTTERSLPASGTGGRTAERAADTPPDRLPSRQAGLPPQNAKT